MIPMSGHEDALFLSLQNRRMAVRSVENLVKKYSRLVTTVKNITPHKLRSTYGTTLYQETGDIYLVADVLGHKDVNTTKKHYAHRRTAGAGWQQKQFVCGKNNLILKKNNIPYVSVLIKIQIPNTSMHLS